MKNYVLVYVDAESGKRLRLPSGERITEADLGPHYKVVGTPVFVYLEPDGKVIGSIPGMQTVQNFRGLRPLRDRGTLQNAIAA